MSDETHEKAAQDNTRWHTVWEERWRDYYAASIQVNDDATAVRVHARGGLVVTLPLESALLTPKARA